MKKKLLISALLLLTMPITSVFGANIEIIGKAPGTDLGVTVMLLKKNTSKDNLKSEDIVYIDQYSTDENGNFNFVLPLANLGSYDFYSNAYEFSVNDESYRTRTAFVSSSGSDSNDGSIEKPYKTISHAAGDGSVRDIVLLNDATYDIGNKYSGKITIHGNNNSVKLKVPNEITLGGDLELENLNISGAATIYAAGCKLVVGNNVSSTDRLTVFGGANNANVTGDTNISLYGGKYNNIYGGGRNGKVSGNTYVTVGGSVNPNDGIDDDKSNISPTKVYGGGTGNIGGSTNVTLEGNAKVKYLIGAGTGTNGTAKETHININGGAVMNVYGGSDNTTLTDCRTEINMNGGLAEALFGGSESAAMSGHTYINLNGGEVMRRVYAGCYNNWSLGWKSDRYVKGTTVISISPGVLVNNKSGKLGSGNRSNMGIFCGSRTKAAHSDEINTLIYLNDSYEDYKNEIGDVSGWSGTFKSFQTYTVKAGTGGKILGTNNAGVIFAVPDQYKHALIGEVGYVNETAAINEGTTTVSFKGNTLDVPSKTVGSDSISGTAEYSVYSKNGPYVVIAVYDSTGRLISIDRTNATAEGNYTFNLGLLPDAGKYTLKAFMWDNDLMPMTYKYEFYFTK